MQCTIFQIAYTVVPQTHKSIPLKKFTSYTVAIDLLCVILIIDSEQTLETAVAQQPVQVFVDAANPSFMMYKSGVYYQTRPPYVSSGIWRVLLWRGTLDILLRIAGVSS